MRRSVTIVAFALTLAASASARAQVDQIMSSHACNGSMPQANEVFIFTDPNFGGTCAALFEGFYPNPSPLTPGSFGLPNDSISSIKVGSAVRARLFQAIVYGGNFTMIGAMSILNTMMAGWDNTVSSIRVERASRSTICDDLRAGEFALFRDANFISDCVVLFYGHSYQQPINMGIANDSVSSVRPGPPFAPWSPDPNCSGRPFRAVLYNAGNYGGPGPAFSGGDPLMSFLATFNDVTSSVISYQICIIP
jgi:hypothetical protein